jgi:thiamine biosynthesis lipoprotein
MLHLDSQSQSVRLAREGIRIDLGGIAKGYAADAAIAELKRRGATRALVAAGGDVVVGDPPPGKRGWVVGVAPFGRDDRLAGSLLLANCAVSTSGDAEQRVELNGMRYSHIIDPRSGMALTRRQGSTVVAREGSTADALATSLCVLDLAKALATADSVDGAAAIVVVEQESGIETHRSSRWSDLEFFPEEKLREANFVVVF